MERASSILILQLDRQRRTERPSWVYSMNQQKIQIIVEMAQLDLMIPRPILIQSHLGRKGTIALPGPPSAIWDSRLFTFSPLPPKAFVNFRPLENDRA